jgi:hypothetical protein
MTPEQADDWALGHQVVQGNNVYWVTPSMVYGNGPQATAPMPEGMGGVGTTVPASSSGTAPAASPAAASTPAGQPTPFLSTPYVPNENQSKARTYADRMVLAAPIIDQFGYAGTDIFDATAGGLGVAGTFLTSDAYKQFQNAGDMFISGILRKDSGAALTADERAVYGRMYLPQPNDPPEVLEQKRKMREQAIASMIGDAGPGYAPPAMPGSAPPPGSATAAEPPPTGATLNTAPAATAPGGAIIYPEPKTAEERDALAPGTVYKAPDGTFRVRGQDGG